MSLRQKKSAQAEDRSFVPVLEERPLETLKPYPGNAKTHPQDQIERLKKMLAKGPDQPIVVDAHGVIIKGHGRLEAAKQLGWKTFPVVVRTDLTEEEARAHRLGDNQNALSPLDMDLVSAEMEYLLTTGIDLDLTGFPDWKAPELPSEPLCDEDEVPEAQKTPVVERGQVWLCGPHRVMCGDSTSAEDVATLMVEAKAEMIFTDPPYGVSYDSSWRALLGTPGKQNTIQGDDAFPDFLSLWPAAILYVWHASCLADVVLAQVRANAMEPKSQIIWRKPWSISQTHYNQLHEPCFYCVRDGERQKWVGPTNETTVWELPDFRSPRVRSTQHPTEKPVALGERAIGNHSCTLIADPFLGSGSTLIACEKLGRTCYGMEIDPLYVGVILDRYSQFTGKEPTLESTGETWSAYKAAREAC